MNYQVMPDLTPIEYEALKIDIAERGVLVPVEVDENGQLLDGHHRVRAWRELKAEGVDMPDYPRMVRSGMTEEQKRNHARSLNVLRRQLSKEQRDEVMRDMRADGMSYRAIAAAVGVDHKTVMTAVKQGGEYSPPESVIGKDGKTYPAQQQPKPEAPPTMFEPGGTVALEPKAAEEQAKIFKQEKRQAKEDKREERREENHERAKQTDDLLNIGARFATILIDPPWDWGDEGDINQMGRAKPDYSTMPMDDLLQLPVAELADVDCHMYLWITNRSLPKGFQLLGAWGFRYITCITWVKPSFGMGNYFRGQTEHLLFGVKGSQPLKRKNAGTVFHAARGEMGHSSKPEEVYGLIESCSPGPYLELFARTKRDGWLMWGADA
jgi:N6-adenosine-specific RNA methylase IME4/ParB-like chromosome segregation protein Spo0J